MTAETDPQKLPPLPVAGTNQQPSEALPEPPVAPQSPWMPQAPASLGRRIGRWLLLALALYGLGWLFWAGRSALLPFLFGMVLAYLFLPLVNVLNQRMPRWAAILIVYLGGLLVFGIFVAYIVPPLINQIGQLLRFIPTSLTDVESQINRMVDRYEQVLAELPPELAQQIQEGVNNGINQALAALRTNFTSYVQGLGMLLVTSVIQVANTVTFLLGFFLVPFWLFYVLNDSQRGREALDSLLPARIRIDFWTVATIIDRNLTGYLRGQLLLGFAVGLAAGLGLFVLGLFGLNVDSILLLAIIAGITELIPVIGPIIGSIPAIILGFFDSPTTGLAVIILYIMIQQLENNFLVPRIVGDSIDIHPSVLMVLLVVASQVFGLAGAILCAPLAAVARDVFSYTYGRLSDPPRPAGVLPERLRIRAPVGTAPQAAGKPAPEQ